VLKKTQELEEKIQYLEKIAKEKDSNGLELEKKNTEEVLKKTQHQSNNNFKYIAILGVAVVILMIAVIFALIRKE